LRQLKEDKGQDMKEKEVVKILKMNKKEYEKLSFKKKLSFNMAIPFGSISYQPERLSEKTS
jgi:hypothetical protein